MLDIKIWEEEKCSRRDFQAYLPEDAACRQDMHLNPGLRLSSAPFLGDETPFFPRKGFLERPR